MQLAVFPLDGPDMGRSGGKRKSCKPIRPRGLPVRQGPDRRGSATGVDGVA